MARLFGHYVPREMMALLSADLLVLFTILCVTFDLRDATAYGNWLQISAAAACTTLAVASVAVVLGLYRFTSCQDMSRVLLAGVVGALLAATITAAIGGGLHNAPDTSLWHYQPLLAKIGVSVFALCVVRLGFRMAIRHKLFLRRVLVIGSGLDIARACEAVHAQWPGCVEFAGLPSGAASREGCPSYVTTVVNGPAPFSSHRLQQERIWGVLVGAEERRGLPNELLLGFRANGIEVFGGTDFGERQLRRVDVDGLDSRTLAAIKSNPNRLHMVAGWLLDVLVCVSLLLLTLPLMLATALLIRLDSPGPVFYAQERIGLNGRSFRILKFRSMRTDAEASGVPVWAAKNDSRVTRVGRFIRFTRIDELPQLLNVLRGDMRLVGPRPERPHFVRQLEEVVPGYAARAQVKPGITGWAQVNYPYGASVEDARMKLAYDLYYVKHQSVFLDLLIILDTVRVVLFREGSR